MNDLRDRRLPARVIERRFRNLLGYSRAEVTVVPLGGIEGCGAYKVRFVLGVRHCAIMLTEEQMHYPIGRLQETHLTQVVDMFHKAGVPQRSGPPI